MSKLLIVFSVLLMGGCGNVLAPQTAKNVGAKLIGEQGEVYAVPANVRMMDIRKKNADYVVCSDPVPDVAVANALKLALDASQNAAAKVAATVGDNSTSNDISNAVGVKGSYDVSTTALELAGRTQIVLLAREFLSSNCKARAYGWLKENEFQENQKGIIEQITAIIKAEQEKSSAEKAKADAQKVEAIAEMALDKGTLAKVNSVFGDAILSHCTDNLSTCLIDAKGDTKKNEACKSSYLTCSN